MYSNFLSGIGEQNTPMPVTIREIVYTLQPWLLLPMQAVLLLRLTFEPPFNLILKFLAYQYSDPGVPDKWTRCSSDSCFSREQLNHCIMGTVGHAEDDTLRLKFTLLLLSFFLSFSPPVFHPSKVKYIGTSTIQIT